MRRAVIESPFPLDERGRLHDRINAALCNAAYGKDERRLRALQIDLCTQIQTELDEEQAEAVDIGRRFLAGEDVSLERARLLQQLSARVDADLKNPDASSRTSCRNRMAWATLLTTTGLDDYAGEFAADMALDAGLTVAQVEAAFERHVPEMRNDDLVAKP